MTYRELLGKLCVLTVALLLGSVVMPQPCSAQTPAQKRPTPLTRDVVFKMLSAKTWPQLLDMMARDNGIDFPITPEIENELLKAGATPELVATLQEVAPKPVTPTKSAQIVVETQPDAQVYLDDTFKGQTSSQGRLVIENPTPGQHVLRISMTGKKDHEQSITVVSGQDEHVGAPLESLAGSIRVRASMPAQVRLDDFDRGSTDPNGQLVMPDIAPGTHVLRISAEGKKDYRQTVNVLPAHESVVDAAMAADNQPPPGAAPVSPERMPWTKDQIIRMLKGDMPPKRVAELARERRIDFPITGAVEKELQDSGADGALVAALRDLAPKPAPASAPPAGSFLKVESRPGGAQVFVDDVLIARTSQSGRLVVPASSGKRHVRVALEGYSDFETEVELGPGQTAEVTAELKGVQSTSPRAAPATPARPPRPVKAPKW